MRKHFLGLATVGFALLILSTTLTVSAAEECGGITGMAGYYLSNDAGQGYAFGLQAASNEYPLFIEGLYIGGLAEQDDFDDFYERDIDQSVSIWYLGVGAKTYLNCNLLAGFSVGAAWNILDLEDRNDYYSIDETTTDFAQKAFIGYNWTDTFDTRVEYFNPGIQALSGILFSGNYHF